MGDGNLDVRGVELQVLERGNVCLTRNACIGHDSVA